jgi:hypothetical protein
MNLDEERDRLLALAEKATPGPWTVDRFRRRGEIVTCCVSQVTNTDSIALACEVSGPNGRFIAAAHDMAALIRAQAAEIERLRADAERYRWLRSRVPGSAYRIIGVIYSDGGEGIDRAIDAAIAAERKGDEQFPKQNCYGDWE